VSVRRILVPAQMTGRELARRRLALGLLTLLPLAFYGASAHHSDHAAVTGGIAMAFSIAGASIFAALTARPVDERLVLAGYRPHQLLLGRLLLLELFGLTVAGMFSVVMALGTAPSEPWALVAGVMLVAITSVPFGLAVGTLVAGELEGVLILIGVVGIQLTLESTQTIAKLLPFWGPQRLLQHAIDGTVPIGVAIPVNLLYAVALLGASAYIMRRRAPSRRESPPIDREHAIMPV
jgi:hypothetical protein